MEKNETSLDVAKKVIRIEAESVASLVNQIDENFSHAVETIYKSKGRVIITGLGKSGIIGKKISATLTSTGTASYFLHAAEGPHGDLGMVHKNDVVICISKSGETEEVYNLLSVFKKLNLTIIAMTGKLNSSLARHADIVLNIAVKEEACPYDLAPTSSTTATLVMGDALAIALLKRRNFSREDFALIHPGGTLGKRLLTTVDDLMEKGERLPYCSNDDDMKKVTIEMAHKRGICPIVNEHFNVIGVITTGDLNRLLEQTEKFFHILAGDVMNKRPKLVVSGTLAFVALQKMEQYRIIAMPVINKYEKLIGIVHLHEILQAGIEV
jgi:arabinose-5-phosphate isomerase